MQDLEHTKHHLIQLQRSHQIIMDSNGAGCHSRGEADEKLIEFLRESDATWDVIEFVDDEPAIWTESLRDRVSKILEPDTSQVITESPESSSQSQSQPTTRLSQDELSTVTFGEMLYIDSLCHYALLDDCVDPSGAYISAASGLHKTIPWQQDLFSKIVIAICK